MAEETTDVPEAEPWRPRRLWVEWRGGAWPHNATLNDRYLDEDGNEWALLDDAVTDRWWWCDRWGRRRSFPDGGPA